MAKHIHSIILVSKRVWKCRIPECTWFIHLGQQYLLPGRTILCGECNEPFTMSQEEIEHALRDDVPKCNQCRSGGIKTTEGAIEEMIDLMTTIRKRFGVKQVSEVDPIKIRALINMGITTQRAVDLARQNEFNRQAESSHSMTSPTPRAESDSIQSEHLSDCATCLGLPCDCK